MYSFHESLASSYCCFFSDHLSFLLSPCIENFNSDYYAPSSFTFLHYSFRSIQNIFAEILKAKLTSHHLLALSASLLFSLISCCTSPIFDFCAFGQSPMAGNSLFLWCLCCTFCLQYFQYFQYFLLFASLCIVSPISQ